MAPATVSQKEKSLIQAAEDRIGGFTEQLSQLGDPKRWSDRVEAARAIPEPQKMVDSLAEIERDKSGVVNIQAELEIQIVGEIRKMYPTAIKLLQAVIKRLDSEIANIKGDQEKVDKFWGLKTVESSNWLLYGIQRLKSGLESNLQSLKSNSPTDVSICRYVLSESGVLEPKAKVQSP